MKGILRLWPEREGLDKFGRVGWILASKIDDNTSHDSVFANNREILER